MFTNDINNNLNFSIEHAQRTDGPHNMSSKHYHNGYEIYYLLDGERYYFIEERTYHVKKGSLVLINKNILHKTLDAADPAHERILISFNDKYLYNLIEEINDINLYFVFKNNQYLLTPSIEKQLWLENFLFKMIRENKQKKVGFKSCLKSMLIQLLIFINRLSKTNQNLDIEHPDPTSAKISEIANYIKNNYQQELKLKTVAEKFNLTPSYLSKTFKKITGFNFVEYKNNVRVKEARKLLQQTNSNITQIAGKAGYNNITHFGRTFKKITGYSPLNYRKLYENK